MATGEGEERWGVVDEPTTQALRASVAIFRTRCTVSKKVCNVIIDSGSCENLVSKVSVNTLNLQTDVHLKPYKIGWIKRGTESQVNKQCKVPLSIGKLYQDEVVCDVVDMDA